MFGHNNYVSTTHKTNYLSEELISCGTEVTLGVDYEGK